MSWETTDVLSADTTDVLSADTTNVDTTDVLSADTTDVSSAAARNLCAPETTLPQGLFSPQKKLCAPEGTPRRGFSPACDTIRGGCRILDPIFQGNVAKSLYFKLFGSRRGTQKRIYRIYRIGPK